MRDTLLVRLAAVLCRAENDGAQARASCLPAVGGAALQLTKRPGRKPSGAASGGFCKSLLRPFTHDFGALITLPVSGVCESGFTSRTGPSAPPTLRSKHALNADVGSRHRNRDRDRYRDRTSCDPIARGAARDGSKWTIPIPIAIWMRASSGQSRDRTRSREGDEAVVYVYVNGYGDEGPQKPCRSADCMALTGCMSHPQF